MAVTTDAATRTGADGVYRPRHPVRVVTATSLYDGHDAAINIVRRILQDSGAEVIHLGHNRSVTDIVDAAIQEDAQAIAASSYQGGHIEFFTYMIDLLRERGAGHIRVFGGGGGVIIPSEIRRLEDYGVAKIYSPEDGRSLGLQGMINHLLETVDRPIDLASVPALAPRLSPEAHGAVARYITAMEQAKNSRPEFAAELYAPLKGRIGHAPVLGVTGTGGAGKSSTVDELLLRFLHDFPQKTIAVLSVDPSRKRTGGALLGDRIRMNALDNPRVYMRSLATRDTHSEICASLQECIDVAKAAGFDLVIVETAGIGQGDAAVVPYCAVALYVMTAEYGAASQLEKIDMLDFADLVVINKFDRKGAEDAFRDVRKQVQRNKRWFDRPLEDMPVYGAIASRFNDDGLTALYHGLLDALNAKCGVDWASPRPRPSSKTSASPSVIVPGDRVRYLAEIAECVRGYHAWAEKQAGVATAVWRLDGAREDATLSESAKAELAARRAALWDELDGRCKRLLEGWPALRDRYGADEFVYAVRGKEVRTPLHRTSLSGTRIPRVALPRYENPGDLLRCLLKENLPGAFPFTAGVFPFKRDDEDPTRMFAGEGDAARTNARFHYLSRNSPAKRLSTAFDSVTLYGQDPDIRPDIYGKVGTSGVSICCLDDMRRLYEGFDLCAPNTSVSMTINGPAPIILAYFFNAAIAQQLEKFRAEQGREPSSDEAARIEAETLATVRGTVQADILKEDQGQNTCIFAIDFALKMMGDMQQYFIDRDVRNFYSVSISGYHIAEAGANPISQAAFTLANGFTFVEYYLARGMAVDDFAPNLSFFFSNGMDPEYAVLNRVARRIWAVAMDRRYGANERAQKLKAHIQTSGRSLHAQEMSFNDIRTTLQALTALYDNCNSLHTNAYDEAVTTPSEESVRRAMAIQLIINREYGLYKNENVLQGSFIIDELTALVEEAVLQEFERISERGGVLGAMERGYQRARIQEESLLYEYQKDTGVLPIVGVNMFTNPNENLDAASGALTIARGTDAERQAQLARVADLHARHAAESAAALAQLKAVCLANGNTFAALMDAAKVCTLGQITQALYEVGGKYRRNA